MNSSSQKELITDVLQGVPSLAFLVLWQSGLEIELAGWIGSALAALVLIGFWLRGIRQDPITLGINVHVLMITPLIVLMFELGAIEPARTLAAHAYPGIFISMFFVGVLQIAVGRSLMRGDMIGGRDILQSSLILLVIALGGVWAATQPGTPLTQVALPIMAIFGIRRFLIARRNDKQTGGGTAMAVAPAFGEATGGASA